MSTVLFLHKKWLNLKSDKVDIFAMFHVNNFSLISMGRSEYNWPHIPICCCVDPAAYTLQIQMEQGQISGLKHT
jgi:hypothetical protein